MRTRRILLSVVLTSLATVIAVPPSTVEAQEGNNSESVDIGLPFTGKWAYNVPAGPPYDDIGESHPAGHHTPGGGDWATDLYAPAGTPVRLRLSNPTGV
jgi:hypothetical protein